MKTIIHSIFGFLMLLSSSVIAQEYIASKAKLSKEAIGKTTSVSSDNAILKLDEQSNKFSFSIHLFPILTSTSENDSIARLNQQMIMDYRADFPAGDLDFTTNISESKQYSMDGDLTVNGITKPVKIYFYLQPSIPADNSSRDVHGYPVRMRFALEINPAEFGLDIETAKFTEKITVMIDNGIINRTSSISDQ
ncbi:MAG: YceI family protein [Bacteroidia bacterium]